MPRPDSISLRSRKSLLNLQRFAGGSNLTCQTCSYLRSGFCELHRKQMDPQSEACSHYQGKQQL